MPIKLLSKQEINQKQALQKHAEIEEGRKLAKRVDNLRELAVQEEASLASFRSKTVKIINEEIRKATLERDALLEEVKVLRSELETGFSELKKAEKAIELREQDLNLRENQIEERIALVKTKEKQVKKDYDRNTAITSRLEYANERIKKINEEAELKMQIAEDMFADADLKKNQIERMFQRITEELHSKDITVASRERDITIKEERVKRQEQSLRERELQLIDREQTLEREYARIKNI